MKPGTKNLIIVATSVLTIFFFVHSYYNPLVRFKKQNIPILYSPGQETTNGSTHKQTNTIQQFDHPELIDSFNVLLLGLDRRKEEHSRSDLIMLVNINPQSKNINILSIPRDTRVAIPGIGETKINHAHLLGEEKEGNETGTFYAIRAVSDLLQCDINYYLKIDFNGFEHFIDMIGGVDIFLHSPIKLTYIDQTLPIGDNHLDGFLTLKLVRERYSLTDGDFGRQKNQLKVLKAIAENILSPRQLPKLPDYIKQIEGEVLHTNFIGRDIVSLAWVFKEVLPENINYFQLPGSNKYAYDPLVNKELYYWIPDKEKISELKEHFK